MEGGCIVFPARRHDFSVCYCCMPNQPHAACQHQPQLKLPLAAHSAQPKPSLTSQVFACCGPSCKECPETPYLLYPEQAQQQAQQPHKGGEEEPALCGFELGRYITPFRSVAGSHQVQVS